MGLELFTELMGLFNVYWLPVSLEDLCLLDLWADHSLQGPWGDHSYWIIGMVTVYWIIGMATVYWLSEEVISSLKNSSTTEIICHVKKLLRSFEHTKCVRS